LKKKEVNPTNFELEFSTVWSFPKRGDWATHNPEYRGNFAPQIPRNIIEFFSKPGDLIIDPMCGSGTTLVEAKLLHRNAIGFDINPETVKIAKKNLKFEYNSETEQKVKKGNARKIKSIKNKSVDLIITHPPYLNIVKYSEGKIEGDLSNTGNVEKFCNEIELVANEMFRILKPDKYCAILMGDTRRGCHFVPLAYRVMDRFLKAGFVLKEDIIKAQHNCKMTNYWKWRSKHMGFYMIMHEHLFIFRKPTPEEDMKRIKWSINP